LTTALACVKLDITMDFNLIGNHPSVIKIRELIQMVSDTAFNVLITGETGTGKEVVARLLHRASLRRNQKFIKVNCGALPLNLLESELFGYEKGAFTGAESLKPGKFELASGGVIFLDEIGDMPLILQAKLLQVLQSGDFVRLGGTKDVKVDCWVVAATNHNLERDMQEGRFREDLFYRLNIIKIEIPPLRERRQDIPFLVKHFTQKHKNDLNSKGAFQLGGELRKLFQDYHWPGNVRELSSMVLRLMLGEDPEKITLELLRNMQADGLHPTEIFPEPSPHGEGVPPDADPARLGSLKDVKAIASDYIEKKAILHALGMTGWNKKQAARMLRISYKALFYKMDNLAIERGD
jgi:two-component system, NtrC family, response regulator AtoC